MSPAQWNLKLAAFLVEETDSLFTAVFFACQNFKLAARERMKGMRDPKLPGLCKANGCSPTPLSLIQSIPEIQFEPRLPAATKHISSCPQRLIPRPSVNDASRADSRMDKLAPLEVATPRTPDAVMPAQIHSLPARRKPILCPDSSQQQSNLGRAGRVYASCPYPASNQVA